MYDVLAGVRVIEVSMYAFVPSAAAVLADWGAEVIKVVHPEYGDPMRGTPVGNLPDRSDVDVAFMWEVTNRGKDCVGIDLGTDEGRAVLDDLVATADVFMTNFLPDARARLRIDVDDVRAVNPNLIYARGSGHGSEGPEASRGGFDHTSFWARSGIAHAASMVTGEFIPQVGPAFGDLTSGFNLASGVVAALFRRERTGKPAVVDVSLLGSALWSFSPSLVASELYGVPTIQRVGHLEQPNPLVGVYTTKDRRQIYLSGIRTDANWERFCRHLGHPELGEDERFIGGPSRAAHARECILALDAVFAERTLAEWCDLLAASESAWAVVQTANEALHDIQTVANDYVVAVESASGSTFPLVMSPVKFDEQATALRRAPDHGEQTDDVLQALGYDWDRIVGLKTTGAVL